MYIVQHMKNLLVLLAFLSLLACQSSVQKTGNSKDTSIETTSPKAEAQASFVHQIHEPSDKSATAPLLVLLHGRGSHEGIFYNMAPHLDPRLRVVSVRGPKVLGEKSFAWFDLDRNQEGMIYDGAEVLQCSERIIGFIDQLKQDNNWNPEKVLLGGFSQGAIMSLGTALKHPEKIDAALCLSGHLYPEFIENFEARPAHQELDILVSHGKKDTVLPYSDMQAAVKWLSENKISASTYYYDSGHSWSPENFRDFRAWLTTYVNDNVGD